MQDHHCLYQVGWAVAEWCDGCGMDWAWFRNQRPGMFELECRQLYEQLVEEACDESLPCRRHDETQAITQPWADPAGPADKIEAAGGFTWEQVYEPTEN